MRTRLDPTANERTAYIDSLCQILTYARGPEELCWIYYKVCNWKGLRPIPV